VVILLLNLLATLLASQRALKKYLGVRLGGSVVASGTWALFLFLPFCIQAFLLMVSKELLEL
jgi:hypothetical protein